MNKEFVPYELAVKLKELGFDETCLASYFHAGKMLDVCEYITHGKYTVLAPTFSQAFRWFRENYGLFGIMLPYLITGNRWYYKITNRNNSSDLPFETGFDSYEEAELACLTKLISIVEQQKQK